MCKILRHFDVTDVTNLLSVKMGKWPMSYVESP